MLDPRNKTDQPYVGNLLYHDQFKEVFRSAPSYNNTISLIGGNDRLISTLPFQITAHIRHVLKDNGFLDKTNIMLNLGMEVFKEFHN
jgi:hypothetical protein